MKNLKNVFVAMISILVVACAAYMFIPTMGMIITFSTDTYFSLISGGTGALNAMIALVCTFGYIAIEFSE
jgi:hypothetical protein